MSDRSLLDPGASLQDLFAAALGLEPSARVTFLTRVRAADPAKASHLGALLEASTLPSPLDTPLELTGERLWAPVVPKESLVGTRIGDMQVLRVLGSGSMGFVFEAQQQQPNRRVALKVLRPEAADSADRLMVEAQALARLDHPSIAKVFGAGTEVVQGHSTVWMAFEFVRGAKTLTEHTEDLQLGTVERVKLVLQVCRAIEHAHSKGVLHRDLKPANLLVSGEPEHAVKVIDFGLARFTDPLDGAAQRRTRHGELLGTLLYMSPEQCGGDTASMDVRTDVYGLGIVLFELLTGSFPFDTEDQSIFGVLERVRSGARRRAREFRPDLDKDLEAVVSQASAPVQADRYNGVGALAEDLERWLQGVPVLARRSSFLHRVRLFARRRRAVFIASAAAAVIFIAGAAVIASLVLENLARLREIERRDKVVAAARGELSSVTEILENITASDPRARSLQASLEAERVKTAEEKRAVVARALADLERLEGELLDDRRSWVRLARAYQQVAELHGTSWNAGALDADGRHQANLHALRLWRRVIGTGRSRRAEREALFLTLVHLANSSRAQEEIDFGKSVSHEAVSMAREALARENAAPEKVFDLIDALTARADLRVGDESPTKGLADVEECVQLLDAYVPSVPADVLRHLEYSSWAQLRLGSWLNRSDRRREGAAARREGRRLRLKLIFASASLEEVPTPDLSPSRQIRIAWRIFAPLELVAYRNLGDEDARVETLLEMAQAAVELSSLPPEAYGPTLPRITALTALLIDGNMGVQERAALEGVERLWDAQSLAKERELAAEIPGAIDTLSERGVAFGTRSRRYLEELRLSIEQADY